TEDKLPLGAMGVVGGTFHCGGVAGAVTGQNITYTVQNFTGSTLTWSASPSTGWLDVVPASGSIAAGQNATVTVSLNNAANALLNGSYDASVVFSGGGASATRGVQL